MAMPKNTAKVPNTARLPPAASSGGTHSGAMMLAMRPNPAAHPAPVARTAVGYTSGVAAYTAPHAPRLKNESRQPATRMAGRESATANSTAAAAEPARNDASVGRRPH